MHLIEILGQLEFERFAHFSTDYLDLSLFLVVVGGILLLDEPIQASRFEGDIALVLNGSEKSMNTDLLHYKHAYHYQVEQAHFHYQKETVEEE